MKKTLSLLAAVAISTTACTAAAQTLKVGTGSPKGAYHATFAAMQQTCGEQLPMVAVNTNGSNDNIDRALSNEVNAFFSQYDVLWMRARTEELGGFKTLMTMHREALHFVALSDSGLKAGGVLGFGGKDVVLQNIDQLSGLSVGASGGSATTARIVQLQGEIPYKVVEYASNEDALKALAGGKVQAVLLVGGAPMELVKGLPAAYKLLQVPEATQKKLAAYRPTPLNYRNLNASGVPSVYVESLLLAREFKGAKMVDSLAKFRSCMFKALQDIKETTGTHPAWQSVDFSNKGRWAWMDLPEVK